MTIKWAIDVSYYDAVKETNVYQPVDWQRARDEGNLSLAIIKSSEGETIKDPAFVLQWKAAEGILPRMAYHFFHCNQNPIKQAEACWNIVNSAGFDPSTDYIILDFERVDGQPGAECLKMAKTWLEEIEDRGVKPLIYTYPAFWKTIGGETATWALNYRLGLAQWPKDIWILGFSPSIFTAPRLETMKTDIVNGKLKPMVLKPWTSPALWQFTSRVDSKAIPGHPAIKKVVDYNAIFMDLDGTPPPLLPEVPGAYRYTGSQLKVYQDADANSPQVSQLIHDQTVNVVEIKTISGWQWARLDGPVGWCKFGFLEKLGTSPDPTPVPIPDPTPIPDPIPAPNPTPAPPLKPEVLGLYRFTGSVLKVYSGPGDTYQQVSQLIHDQTANVVEIRTINGWQWARLEGPAGWCTYASLELLAASPAPTPPPTPPPPAPVPAILGLYSYKGTTLKVFAGPAETYHQVSQLIHDQTVNVVQIQVNSGWQWARLDGPVGWCKLASLTKL
jgi:hypothetical protein